MYVYLEGDTQIKSLTEGGREGEGREGERGYRCV